LTPTTITAPADTGLRAVVLILDSGEALLRSIHVRVTDDDAGAVRDRVGELRVAASALPLEDRRELIVFFGRPGRRAVEVRCDVPAVALPGFLAMVEEAAQ
jgi:hypothetical protein